MPAPPFLFANIVGALMWTSVVGYLSFPIEWATGSPLL